MIAITMPPKIDAARRRVMLGMGAAAAGTATVAASAANAQEADPYADPEKAALPPTDVEVSVEDTAVVITDPQVDFLSPDGVTWGVVGESVTEHDTVAEHRKTCDGCQSQRHACLCVTSSLLSNRSRLVIRGPAGIVDAQDRHVRPKGALYN